VLAERRGIGSKKEEAMKNADEIRRAADALRYRRRGERWSEVAWEVLAFTLVALLVAFCLWAVYLAVGAEVPRS
jgi:type VI protein secretion system component VasF